MTLRNGRRPLAIFDVDGTLVDSRASIHACLGWAFEGQGLPAPTYDQGRMIVGLSLHEAMATLAPDAPPATVDALTQGYKDGWTTMHARKGFEEPLYSGAAELLAGLRADGWKIAMATGKSRRGVETVIAMHGWAEVFDSTHCADDGPGKPHPAMVREALKAANASPAEAVMIGDTAFDMTMARGAGVRALGVAWGFHTADEIAAGGADAVFDSFAALEAELDRFAASLCAPAAPICAP